MKKILLLGLILSGCVTSEDQVTKSLTNQGFTEINVQGLDFFSCSENDFTGRSFTAKNVNGQTVSGVVCCGLLKGCTVRW